jgi:(4S)-4-hydroxy-5-phosphonooxypentane-2,3-dione isomerase
MSAPHTHGETPYAITVEFEVLATALPDFLRLVKANAAQSVESEKGCTRFDVLTPLTGREPPDSLQSIVLLYEVYSSRAAFDVHLASAHFRQFDDATRAMVASKTVMEYAVAENAKPTSSKPTKAKPGSVPV